MEVNQIAIGIGVGMGVAALGVGIGQGLAASAGLSGMSRQPEAAGRIQTAMLIALAFIELVFLLTFVVMNGLQGKVPAPAANAGTATSMVQPAERTEVAAIAH
ncbi:MAG TPA: ATP synthase F0 subunit C [Fimbriimonas sp.]